jgi:glc operon protein GlcG
MRRAVVLAILASTLSLSVLAQDLPTKKVLNLALAKRLIAAAEAEALRRGATVVIAVVDDGGHLVLLERLDDTQVASVEVAIGKARTAAIFRRPSKVFEDQVRNGRIAALALPGATPLQGGVPVFVDGKVIGAIGASSNTPSEDEELPRWEQLRLRSGQDAVPSPNLVLRECPIWACSWRPRHKKGILGGEVVKISVLYPNHPDTTFDMSYYLNCHIKLVQQLLAPRLKGVAVEKGICGRHADSPSSYVVMAHRLFESIADYHASFEPHAETIVCDIPNYTNSQPTIQISEIKLQSCYE